MGIRERRMGDPFPGAAEFNEIVRAVRYVNSLSLGGGGPSLLRSLDAGERVVVQNNTLSDIPRFGIVEIYEPVFSPTDNLEEFKGRCSLKAKAPTAAAKGRIAIALEPLPGGVEDPENEGEMLSPGRVGVAIVSGFAVCKVNVTDADATFAKEVVGDATRLETSAVGAIPIVWRESGASGEKWAVVLLGTQAMNPRRFRRLLPITSSSSVGTNVWEYTVSVDGVGAEGRNRYEQSPWGHGQELTFTQGDLTPGPVEGDVWCDLADDGVWEFDIANPLVPDCAE